MKAPFHSIKLKH